jgi:hypothetical protein
MPSNIFTVEDFKKLCPIEHFDLFSCLDEDVLFQFFLDLHYISNQVKDGKLNKDEIFILTNKDFTISIKKFLQNYNRTQGVQFPLMFLLNYCLECNLAKKQLFAIIIAPRTHINYFKLINDVRNTNIHPLDDNLKIMKELPEEWKERMAEFNERSSIRKFQSLTY